MKKVFFSLVALFVFTSVFLPAQQVDLATVVASATGFFSDISVATIYALDGKAWALSVDERNLAIIKEYKEKKAAAQEIKNPKDRDAKVQEINAEYGTKFDAAMADMKASANVAKVDTAKKLGNSVFCLVKAVLLDARALKNAPTIQTAIQAALQNLPKGMAAMKYKDDIKYLKYASGLMPELPGQLNSQVEAITVTINKVKAFAAANKIDLPKTESMTADDKVEEFNEKFYSIEDGRALALPS